MRVCYFGFYNPCHPRNRVTITALHRVGVEVLECNVYGRPKVLRYPLLVWKYLFETRHTSCILVSAGGYFYLPIAWVLAKLTRKTLVFDAFYSLFDTLVSDRKTVRNNAITAKVYRALDKLAGRLADAVVVDTDQHRDYFIRELDTASSKLYVVRVGADDSVFFPRNSARDVTEFIVLYVGSFIPLHGVEYIIEAASLLREKKDIRFVMVGNGQTRPDIEKRLKALQLDNVELYERVSLLGYSEWIARSDICLGVFGDSPKTPRVVPCKVYDAMASGKPIITADTPAIRDLLSNGIHCLLCQAGDAQSLASAILQLYHDAPLRTKIADNAVELFTRTSTPDLIGRKWLAILENLI
jgi:glycosyltransferase involved in cell wall biosynthesis